MYIVTENAKTLIPNKEHKNFTESRTIIPEGTSINGELVEIKGMRKGEPFTYKLFKIKDLNSYLYQNQIKPNTMEKTEVTLGADAQVKPTKVNVPSNKDSNMAHVIGAVVGTASGFAFAKYRKVEGNAKYVYMGVGALAGFFVARMIVKRQAVVVQR
jgi:hypothetical protein